jgi:hypothetical protein
MTLSEKRGLLCVGGPIIFLCLVVIVWIGYKAKGNKSLPIQIYSGRVTGCYFGNYGSSGQRRIGVELILEDFKAQATFDPYKESENIKIEYMRKLCEKNELIELHYRRFRTVWFMEEQNFLDKIVLPTGQHIEVD